jgi:integrase
MEAAVARVHGELRIGPVKTAAGRRDLPLLLGVAAEALETRRAAQAVDGPSLAPPGRTLASSSVPKQEDPSSRGTGRLFHRICEAHGLWQISVHHLRHTTATLLQNLGVPAETPSSSLAIPGWL